MMHQHLVALSFLGDKNLAEISRLLTASGLIACEHGQWISGPQARKWSEVDLNCSVFQNLHPCTI